MLLSVSLCYFQLCQATGLPIKRRSLRPYNSCNSLYGLYAEIINYKWRVSIEDCSDNAGQATYQAKATPLGWQHHLFAFCNFGYLTY